MVKISIREDDFCFLSAYAKAMNTSIDDVIHGRVEIMKSASSFAINFATSLGVDLNSDFEALSSYLPLLSDGATRNSSTF